jgi:hypothetical protein
MTWPAAGGLDDAAIPVDVAMISQTLCNVMTATGKCGTNYHAMDYHECKKRANETHGKGNSSLYLFELFEASLLGIVRLNLSLCACNTERLVQMCVPVCK